MSRLITINWDAFEHVPGERAHLQFIATGFDNSQQVRNALRVQKGNTFDGDVRLIAATPRITTPESPLVFVADIDFEPVAGGGTQSDDASNVKLPPRYKLVLGNTNEPIDQDIYGNPIVNSAMEPFSEQISRPIRTIHYVYRSWVTKFNGPLAMDYLNKINSDRVDLPGFGYIEPGQGLCSSIQMLDEITRVSQAVEVEAQIEIRAGGFKTRILDKGNKAFYGDPAKLGPIFDANGNQISGDVRLNGRGAPFNTELKVGNATTSGMDQDRLPPKVAKQITQLAVYLKYDIYHTRPFKALGMTK